MSPGWKQPASSPLPRPPCPGSPWGRRAPAELDSVQLARIFLSHSSADNAAAVCLRDWLIEQGWDDLFIDLDPERGIAAGERWQERLIQASTRCEVVIFLLSRAWLQSNWCQEELNLARRMSKRLCGVLIEDLPKELLPQTLTTEWQVVSVHTGCDRVPLSAVLPVTHEPVSVPFSLEGLSRLKWGLEQAGVDPRFFAWPPPHDPDRSPYRGLRSLEADDAGVLFGRDAQIIEVLDKLRSMRAQVGARVLVILGASGAGKSSFLRAGVLPRLGRDDRNYRVLPIIRPATNVITGSTGLNRCLADALSANNIPQVWGDDLIRNTAWVKEEVAGLAHLGSPRVESGLGATPPSVVIPIDQAEELFVSGPSLETELFLQILRSLVEETALSVIVIATIRSDAFERLQLTKPWAGFPQQPYSLAPLHQGSFAEVIKGPARRLERSRRTLEIEDALVDALLSDVEDGTGKDALPLLAFALERLYAERGSDSVMRLSTYERLGGIGGAIEAAITDALIRGPNGEPGEQDLRTALQQLRLGFVPWLAAIDPETRLPCRRVARLSELPSDSVPVILRLVDQRLLVIDQPVGAAHATIEAAHEVLLRRWRPLRDWLDQDRDDLALLEGVRRSSQEWDTNGQNAAWLAHTERRLDDVERLVLRADFSASLGTVERSYLAACRAAEDSAHWLDRERIARERAATRMLVRGTVAALIIALLIAFKAGAHPLFMAAMASAMGYLSFSALRHTAKPRFRLHLVIAANLRVSKPVTLSLSITNIGRWYVTPPAFGVRLYCNFEPEFELIELRYGSRQELSSRNPRIGKGGLNYLSAKGIMLPMKGDTESVTLIVRLPQNPGTYMMVVHAISENGAAMEKRFPLKVGAPEGFV